MTSFGSGLAVEVALGGTSTSGVTGIEAGDGLTLFLVILGAWLPELLLQYKKKRHNKLVYVNSQQQQDLLTETRCLPSWYKKLLDIGLSAVAGVNELEAFFLHLRLTGSRGARHFAGTFGCRAGGSSSFPLGETRGFGGFRLRRGFRVSVSRLRDPEESSEFALLECLELRYQVYT
jgi:hypothetical protein